MQNAYDINGRRAQRWQPPKFQFKKLKHEKQMSSIDVFNSVKNNIEVLVNTLYSNKDDRKIRNIVDLLLLRSKSDFENLEIFKTKNDELSFIESIKNIYAETVEQYNEDVDYEDALKAAIDSLEEIFDNTSLFNIFTSDENVKDISSDIDFNEHNNIISHRINNNTILNRSYALDNNIKALNDCIEKTNELISTISSSIDEQFIKLEKLLMISANSICRDIMSVFENINGVQIKQLSYIRNELSNVKMPVFKDAQKKSKKKTKNSIYVYGMNIDAEMIDGLSSRSQKTVMMIAVAIKQHYQKICSPMANIFAVVKGNAKYTIELINDIFQKGFDYWIRRLFGKIQEYVTENIVKPLKKIFVDYIISKIPNVFKRLGEIFNAIIELAKGAWILIKGVFRLIWRFIARIFSRILRGFVKIMRFMFRGVIKVLKAIWNLIVLALKGLWALIRWAGRGLRNMWRWFKNTAFGKKIGRFFHKLGSPFRWVRNKVVNGVRHLKSGVRAFGRGISTGARFVKNKIASGIRTTGRFIGRQFVKAGRVFGRMIPNFARHGFKRMISLIKKIPLRTFFKWIGRKIKNMVLRKALKRQAKKGLIKKIVRGVTKFIGKTLGKIAAKSISAILKIAILAWTIHDLWKGYKYLKKNLEPIFREIGPPDAPDVTQPWWFEKWIISKTVDIIKQWVTDPRTLVEFIKAILKGIWEMFTSGRSMRVLNEKRTQEWQVYMGTYHSFNNTFSDIAHHSYNERNFGKTNGYPTYFGPEGNLNILSSGLLLKLSNLHSNKYDKRPFDKKWKEFSNLLNKWLYNIYLSAGACIRLAQKQSLTDDEFLYLMKQERKLLRSCAAVGITENILIRTEGEPEGMLDTKPVNFYVNYILANNEAVNALRMLDYLNHIDEIRKVIDERVSKLRSFFRGKTINLEYIKEECSKKSKSVHDFCASIASIEPFVEGQSAILETKLDEVEEKLGVDPGLNDEVDSLFDVGEMKDDMNWW